MGSNLKFIIRQYSSEYVSFVSVSPFSTPSYVLSFNPTISDVIKDIVSIHPFDIFTMFPIDNNTYFVFVRDGVNESGIVFRDNIFKTVYGDDFDCFSSVFSEGSIKVRKKQRQVLNDLIRMYGLHNNLSLLTTFSPFTINPKRVTSIINDIKNIKNTIVNVLRKNLKHESSYYNMVTDELYHVFTLTYNNHHYTIHVRDKEINDFFDLTRDLHIVHIHENDPHVVVINDSMINFYISDYDPNYSILYPYSSVLNDYGRVRIIGFDNYRIFYDNDVWVRSEDYFIKWIFDPRVIELNNFLQNILIYNRKL